MKSFLNFSKKLNLCRSLLLIVAHNDSFNP